ncbi:phage tail sheath C-terminal domain-containing protein [Sphingomonas sp. ERG5]|uniref:phage tail sheath C-terminal domain-containing protein n=1 Tax=Sphingomonas sp. ERG5 TaxID=1381597 RepID=UPI00054C1955|nr:phage tail sheath C-terminal domain-containing protein [Sphingomonas sp. ERG5]
MISSPTTPGVYATEIDAFGTAVVGVPTAVPVFVGYTQCAGDPVTGKPLYGVPIAIESMTDFIACFGGAAPRYYGVSVAGAATPDFFANFTTPADAGPTPYTVAMTGFGLQPLSADAARHFCLYWHLRLFFANGGGSCYVVSVGSYWSGQSPTIVLDPVPPGWNPAMIAAGDPATNAPGLLTGLDAVAALVGPTMIVIPEACQLGLADYARVACAMLAQAGTLQSRMAILDLPGCLTADTVAALQQCQDNFVTAIAPQNANVGYGAAYGPALNTSIVAPGDILYTNLVAANGDNSVLNTILTTAANMLYSGARRAALQTAIATAFPITQSDTNTAQYSGSTSTDATPPIPYPAPGADLAAWQWTLDRLLFNALPVFQQIMQLVATDMNVMAPSAALAGIWTMNDGNHGVWGAPANVALAEVASPFCAMTDIQQGGFNLPPGGEAINIVRSQPNRGSVVWGARTLDGNSLDYRFIQVRRTLIYIDQSIRAALQSYAFAANDVMTWATVTASVSAFLTGLWQAGGLMGGKPSDAFTVACGIGSTMTPQDVLNGDMIVAVTLQMIHPAEFIELTIIQAMQG